MHCQLNVCFNEDACRIRVDDRAKAFSRIRQASLNLLKAETRFKGETETHDVYNGRELLK